MFFKPVLISDLHASPTFSCSTHGAILCSPVINKTSRSYDKKISNVIPLAYLNKPNHTARCLGHAFYFLLLSKNFRGKKKNKVFCIYMQYTTQRLNKEMNDELSITNSVEKTVYKDRHKKFWNDQR